MSTTTKGGCLTGAEAAAQATTSSGVLLPSTRAFGRVPLTGGEVDKPRRKERAPVALEDTNQHLTDQQPAVKSARSSWQKESAEGWARSS
jgi:hypothetical protein